MLCGLMLNASVTDANAGQMPVVGMASTLYPMNSTWQAATSNTHLLILADQAWLGMFSVGDIALIGGGILVLTICMRRIVLTQKPSRALKAKEDSRGPDAHSNSTNY